MTNKPFIPSSVSSRITRLPPTYRVFALAGATVLTGAYLAVLYHVIDVVGGPGGLPLFVMLVAGTLGLAVVLGRTLRLQYAVLIGVLLLVAGLGAYLLAIPEGALDLERWLQDTFALLTGLSVLRMTKAGIWALGFTPGPLFVSTYLFLRRRYALGVLVGGGALAFFISTGDIGLLHGLVGSLGAVAALGFGTLDRSARPSGISPVPELDEQEPSGPLGRQVTRRMVLVAAATTTVSLVPGGEARPLLPGDQGTTIESSLVGGGDSVSILGSIELSPKVRFTVEAERPAKWRAGAYDRYTGGSWVRSGQTRPYEGPLNRPIADETTRLRQSFKIQSETNVMPAAWKPTRVVDGADRALVTAMAGLEPRSSLDVGDEYSVVSVQPASGPDLLRNAGRDYPDGLPERYTQLPESTPARLREFTSQLTAEADNPYDTARVVEQWLEANKTYSLEVDRPQGDIAAKFVFEMDRGYCVYFATAMVAMLRSLDIPSRFVTGYTAGEQIDENRWVVRGLDSHAWVEVFFPGSGWYSFDPTPAGPRRNAEQASLRQSQSAGAPNAEADVPTPEQLTPEQLTPAGEQPQTTAPSGPTVGDDPTGGTPTVPPGLLGPGQGPDGSGEGGLGNIVPDGKTILYGFILLAGGATVFQETGLLERARRSVWFRRMPDGPAPERVEAAFERLDYLLGRRYRPRRPGETPRAYLDALRSHGTDDEGGVHDGSPAGGAGFDTKTGVNDRRVDRLYELYERTHYAGRVTEDDADRAERLLRELREEWSAWRVPTEFEHPLGDQSDQ